jgi:hypothetical protein
MPIILVNQEAQEDQGLKPALGNSSQDLSQKYPTQKRAGRVAEVVECLPSKGEVLSSNSSTTKKKKKRR